MCLCQYLHFKTAQNYIMMFAFAGTFQWLLLLWHYSVFIQNGIIIKKTGCVTLTSIDPCLHSKQTLAIKNIEYIMDWCHSCHAASETLAKWTVVTCGHCVKMNNKYSTLFNGQNMSIYKSPVLILFYSCILNVIIDFVVLLFLHLFNHTY